MHDLIGASASTFIKGVGVTVLGSLIFFGSAYVLLSAVFGRLMGYLVTAVSFWGMMIIFSIVFVIGVPGSTPPNLGPRGTRYACPTCISEPHWAGVAATENITSPKFSAVAKYPGTPWEKPNTTTAAQVDALTTVLGQFMVREAQAKEGDAAKDLKATDFGVQNVMFTTQDGVQLAAAQVYFKDGGPILEAFAIFDHGNVPLPSYIFLGVSLLMFAGHLPFLDRAEKKRKDILTGGEAPKFLGPA